MKTIRYVLALCFAGLLARPALAQQTPAKPHADWVSISPSADRDIAIGINYVKALVAGDWTNARNLMAPGFTQYGPGAPDSTNAEQYAGVWQTRYEAQQNRVVRIIAATSVRVSEGNTKGDWVMLWFDYSALFTREDRTVRVPVQLTLLMDKGKVAVERTYFDSGSLLTQLGWTMSPPQTAKK